MADAATKMAIVRVGKVARATKIGNGVAADVIRAVTDIPMVTEITGSIGGHRLVIAAHPGIGDTGIRDDIGTIAIIDTNRLANAV